jgi:hypothetical protein
VANCPVRDQVRGEPTSSEIRATSSSPRALSALPILASTSARSDGLAVGQGPLSNAVRAAVTAAATPAAVASGTVPTTSSVAGERTSILAPDEDGCQPPPTKTCP